MDFPVAQLFDYFLASPEPTPLDTLQDLLQIPPGSVPAEQLAIALHGLTKLGFLEQTDQGYRYRADPTLVPARLRCYNKGYCFAIRDDADVDDVYIYASNLNGAWNGDRVLTRITKEGYRKRSPEGEVAAVIERVNLTVVARIQNPPPEQAGPPKAIPLDDRLMFEVELPEQTPGSLGDGQVVYVEITRYPLANLPTQGRVLKVLGSDPSFSMDADLICSKYGLPQSFPESVTAAAQSLPKTTSKAELKKRQDYRDWFTLTLSESDLSQPGSLEPTVALSLRPGDETPETATWQLGIHIADLTPWVEFDSPLAQEARQRCRSAHLDTVILPLYPQEVTQQCLLLPQQERLCWSVLITLSATGELLTYEIQPSVIRTSAHLTYAQVAALLATELGDQPSDLLTLLHHLHHLTTQCRQQRHAQGGFTLTAAADPLDSAALLNTSNPAQPMVKECQVLAETVIGEHLLKLGIPAVAYQQPAPNLEALQSFVRLASPLGVVTTVPEGITVQEIQQWSQQLPEDPTLRRILAESLLAALPPLSYQVLTAESPVPFSRPLAVPCAAPLHRYADLLNQYALQALCSKGKEKSAPRSKTVADIRSRRSHGVVTWSVLPPKTQEELLAAMTEWIPTSQAQLERIRQAEQELQGLKKSAFMQAHLGETLSGVIVRVQNYGFFVQVEPLLAEGLVHVRSLKDDWYEYLPKYQALVGRKNRKQFRIGERVDVQVKSVDYYRQQTDLLVMGEGQVFEGEDL